MTAKTWAEIKAEHLTPEQIAEARRQADADVLEMTLRTQAMTIHPHFIGVCRCGAVIRQCRCVTPNKPEVVVQAQCPKCLPLPERSPFVALFDPLPPR